MRDLARFAAASRFPIRNIFIYTGPIMKAGRKNEREEDRIINLQIYKQAKTNKQTNVHWKFFE